MKLGEKKINIETIVSKTSESRQNKGFSDKMVSNGPVEIFYDRHHNIIDKYHVS